MEEKKEVIPPLDFSSLVVPFYARALEAIERGELALALRLMELIDLLEEKTRGNLTEEEREFLASTAAGLKILYLKKTGGEK